MTIAAAMRIGASLPDVERTTSWGAPTLKVRGTMIACQAINKQAEPGTLAHFLTERYRLYAADPKGRLRAGEIHHPPWKLQPAWARVARNTMADACGLRLDPGAPELVHFARLQEVLIWAPRAIG